MIVVSDAPDGFIEPPGVLDGIESLGKYFIITTEDGGLVPRQIIDLDFLTREGVGDFEAFSPEADAAVGTDGFGDFHPEEVIDILCWIKMRQGLALIGKFPIEGRYFQGGVDGLMITGNPFLEIGVELLESSPLPTGEEAVPQGPEKAFNLSTTLRFIWRGMGQSHVELGGDQTQMFGAEGSAIVGVKTPGYAEAPDGQHQVSQQAFRIFG